MESKIFEIRDRATFIVAAATKVVVKKAQAHERKLLQSVGYLQSSDTIVLTSLSTGKSQIDPINWGDRTMRVAHDYLIEKFSDLDNTAVIDVQFILGETEEKKTTELNGPEMLFDDDGY
jgi:ABC-type uncharacterized transport system auxiliary subunit